MGPKADEDEGEKLFVSKLTQLISRAKGAHVLGIVIQQTVEEFQIRRIFVQKMVGRQLGYGSGLRALMQEIPDHLWERIKWGEKKKKENDEESQKR